VCEVLAQVRRAKTEAKVSQRAGVERLVVSAPINLHSAIEAGRADISDAGSVVLFDLETATELSCSVTLGESLQSL
jgi:valyl-tRNA synthetase